LVEGSNSILQGLDGIAVYPTLFHPTFPHASDLQL
jgi:hypothetical protein